MQIKRLKPSTQTNQIICVSQNQDNISNFMKRFSQIIHIKSEYIQSCNDIHHNNDLQPLKPQIAIIKPHKRNNLSVVIEQIGLQSDRFTQISYNQILNANQVKEKSNKQSLQQQTTTTENIQQVSKKQEILNEIQKYKQSNYQKHNRTTYNSKEYHILQKQSQSKIPEKPLTRQKYQIKANKQKKTLRIKSNIHDKIAKNNNEQYRPINQINPKNVNVEDKIKQNFTKNSILRRGVYLSIHSTDKKKGLSLSKHMHSDQQSFTINKQNRMNTHEEYQSCIKYRKKHQTKIQSYSYRSIIPKDKINFPIQYSKR